MDIKIGLIGATAPLFFADEFKELVEKFGYAWFGWTVPIRKETFEILKQQIKENGYFKLYGYSSGWAEGGYNKAFHKIKAVFIVNDIPYTHWEHPGNGIRCPEPEKAITGKKYKDYFIAAYESGHGKNGKITLPRKTWFKVSKVVKKDFNLTADVFTPYRSYHKIHPSALMNNFIDIVDKNTV